MNVHPGDFLTIALLVLLEGLLSADNALVLAMLVLGLPRKDQKKSLRYGIAGAFAFRIIAVTLAIHLIRVAWIKLVGAVYLMYLAYQHFFAAGGTEARREIKPARPWLGLSAFWATVVKVELTDVVFAVDSILVAVAMSPKTWVVITGGLLGIVTMRMVIGKLLSLVRRYPALVDGAFIIIAWVGLKLGEEYLHTAWHVGPEIPQVFSISLIVAIFTIAFVYAKMQGPVETADPLQEQVEQVLAEEQKRE